MISKFDQIYKNSYKVFLQEEAPQNGDQLNQNNENPEIPSNDSLTNDDIKSELADPKEQETVSINLINQFIDFMNLPEEERQKFLNDTDFLSARADSQNYKEKINRLKELTETDLPKPSI